ncbi:hypothetical protein PIB30_038613 [Stylosanthes scabra]|uniref:CCHC-type domain-containing protein n=1 Tax=Stylosanthes scabra TaxID=79078 RepID=A0ABU6SDY5_9FABA|nr:hypothetical protein [Stylosanthes scabra]
MPEMHLPNSEEGEGISVKDPAHARTKGTTRVNDSSAQKGPNQRKCSNCGRLGHRRTRCRDRESHRQCEEADGVPSQAASQFNIPGRNGPKESEKESRGSGGGPNGITKRKG